MAQFVTAERIFDDEESAIDWALKHNISNSAKWILKRRWESDNGVLISNASYRLLFGYRLLSKDELT